MSFTGLFLIISAPNKQLSNQLQVLEGQRVVPARAKELGFPFKYRYVKDALKAIMSWSMAQANNSMHAYC